MYSWFYDRNTENFIREKCFWSFGSESWILELGLCLQNGLFISVITESYPFNTRIPSVHPWVDGANKTKKKIEFNFEIQFLDFVTPKSFHPIKHKRFEKQIRDVSDDTFFLTS